MWVIRQQMNTWAHIWQAAMRSGGKALSHCRECGPISGYSPITRCRIEWTNVFADGFFDAALQQQQPQHPWREMINGIEVKYWLRQMENETEKQSENWNWNCTRNDNHLLNLKMIAFAVVRIDRYLIIIVSNCCSLFQRSSECSRKERCFYETIINWFLDSVGRYWVGLGFLPEINSVGSSGPMTDGQQLSSSVALHSLPILALPSTSNGTEPAASLSSSSSLTSSSNHHHHLPLSNFHFLIRKKESNECSECIAIPIDANVAHFTTNSNQFNNSLISFQVD